MPSQFQAALAAADLAIDGEMGEQVQVTPMRNGEFARQPDASQPAFDVIALVSDGRTLAQHIASLETKVASEEWIVEIRRAVLGARRLRVGDELILLDRPDSPHLVVNRVARTDEGRIELTCGPTSAD